MIRVEHLTVNHGVHREAVDHFDPVFGFWITQEEGIPSDYVQEAYRIRVASTERGLAGQNADMWDSGYVNSAQMSEIPYEGAALRPDHDYHWQVAVRQKGQPDDLISENAKFSTGLMVAPEAAESMWNGAWLGEEKDHCYHRYRHVFTLEEPVVRAKLYLCGLGQAICCINGSQAGDARLETGWTDYDKTCLYSVHDVTALLSKGGNGVSVELGDGMFHVPGGRFVYVQRSYGKARFLMQLNITLSSGKKVEIVSGSQWKMAPSDMKFGCIYGGEDRDGRMIRRDCSDYPFREEDDWVPALCVNPPKGKLRAQFTEPLIAAETLAAVEIRRISEDTWLYDFGTNFSGSIRMKLTRAEAEGKEILLYPGETLNEEGMPDQRIMGNQYWWTYITNDQETQVFEPKFSYTGFRYLCVKGAVPEGIQSDLPWITSLEGLFLYPRGLQQGSFWCSNPLFQKIHQIVTQAMKSNCKSILTDCPTREKLGWLEQTHLIGPGLMYEYDVQNLYHKIQMDMKDAQHGDGLVPDICPEYVKGFERWHTGFLDSPEWGSACVINPWYVYKRYGDRSLMESYYPQMKQYVDYLISKTHHEILHHGLGDWLDIGPNTPHSQNTPVPVIATAIYYYDLCIMENVAGMLGKTGDAAQYGQRKEQVFQEYNRQFYDDQTARFATGSQAAQALSLVTGLVDPENRQKVLDYLVKDIEGRGYVTTAGDIGHPFVLRALYLGGRSDVVSRMMLVTDRPGYGFQVVHGATTLTEEWDGPETGNVHGSQNHLMLGGVIEWFYEGLAGIRMIHEGESMEEVKICPSFVEECDEVRAQFAHPYGTLGVHWKREAEGILVELQIPPGVKAHFVSEKNEFRKVVGSGMHEIRLGYEAIENGTVKG